MGEQELINLLLFKNEEEVYSFLNSHSSNKEDREKLIQTILTMPDPLKAENIECGKHNSVKEIIKAYAKTIGVEISS